MIRELNQRFEEIGKFNDRVTRLEEAYGGVEKKVTALEEEMGRVEECLVRLVTDHNQLVKLLQPPELQRYPADLMPREVRTDAEGKVAESKIVTKFEEDQVVGEDRATASVGGIVVVGSGLAGMERTGPADPLSTIDETREEQERAVHTLLQEVPDPRPETPQQQ